MVSRRGLRQIDIPPAGRHNWFINLNLLRENIYETLSSQNSRADAVPQSAPGLLPHRRSGGNPAPQPEEPQAENISGRHLVADAEGLNLNLIFDGAMGYGYASAEYAEITLTFDNGPVTINEIVAYTPGQVPDTVQKREAPKEDGTDLILFSTHSDDEQLFFAGLLPYYAAELDYEVLVVYLTDHHNVDTTRRSGRCWQVFGPWV